MPRIGLGATQTTTDPVRDWCGEVFLRTCLGVTLRLHPSPCTPHGQQAGRGSPRQELTHLDLLDRHRATALIFATFTACPSVSVPEGEYERHCGPFSLGGGGGESGRSGCAGRKSSARCTGSASAPRNTQPTADEATHGHPGGLHALKCTRRPGHRTPCCTMPTSRPPIPTAHRPPLPALLRRDCNHILRTAEHCCRCICA